MPDRITPKQFHEADGVDDWRVIGEGACTVFRTGTLAVGAQLAEAISALPALDAHHPDLDLRHDGVTVRLITVGPDGPGLSTRDLALAREISAVARTLEIPADPSGVQTVQVAVDALDIPAVLPFWRAVLGYDVRGGTDLLDPRGRGAPFWFQQMDAPRPQRNRIHIDVYVPHDQAQARIAAALAAGGRLVTEEWAPEWWTLSDPEGNEVDIATTHTRG
ncbi:VOC family protein [Cellulomonas soli]|nr:VOC family protein [Cellulomonas soli]NYI57424.1 4a-hydroxytetrahydrobiopterin dehydratase [Cellulomonas soli]